LTIKLLKDSSADVAAITEDAVIPALADRMRRSKVLSTHFLTPLTLGLSEITKVGLSTVPIHL
jgi:hypothetical protein